VSFSKPRSSSTTAPLLFSELRSLIHLALPVVGAQVGSMAMSVVDTMMVGRLSVEALAASSLGSAWVFALLLFGQGLVMGIDPLVTQAHGAGDGHKVARATQLGVVVALLVSVPISFLIGLTEHTLLFLGQSSALSSMAHDFAVVQIPSVPFFLLFVVLRQYLQGRGVVRPTFYVTVAANLFNVAANYALIFGKFGYPALGLVGAGVATTLSRAFMPIVLILVVRAFSLHHGAWLPWSRSALGLRELRVVLALGIPVAVQMSLEIFAFSAASLIAGRLGALALAAHTVVLNMAALAFMIPLGISHATVTRVGNLIGAGRHHDAQRAAWVALALGATVMTMSATIFVVGRNWLPSLYTADAEVIAGCALILPIAAAFQIFDGLQAVGAGVLRGMGRTRPGAVFNLFAFWVLGLPVGGWLALRAGWGLSGLWWGLCLGLATVAMCLIVWIHRRGPSRQLS
jgi:MATE family multidrug resistance protein